MNNPYDVLGVMPGADEQTIKSAYRRLVLRWHPDRNDAPGASREFQRVVEAYRTLSDPGRMFAYLVSGTDALWDPQPRRRRVEIRRGADIDLICKVPLSAVLEGRRLRLTYVRFCRCDACAGTGSWPPFLSDVCERCDGMGRILVRASRRLRLAAGFEDNTRFLLRGAGHAGPGGGPSGDLQILVRVKPHDIFKRHGRDLHTAWRVTKEALVRKSAVRVPTLEGPIISVSLPRDIRFGEMVRVRGRGLPPRGGGSKGDIVIRVVERV